jgi:hypothetical protein
MVKPVTSPKRHQKYSSNYRLRGIAMRMMGTGMCIQNIIER